jgi:prepilin-type N-terminal cleavage/methylation domain-containing protein
MKRWRHLGPGQAGFSMIELLVVIAIAAILLGAALPAMHKYTGTAKLLGTSDEIASTLKLARQRAVSTDGFVVVQFDVNNDRYYLFDDLNQNGSRDGDETMAGPYKISSGVDLVEVDFRNNRVRFGASGAASEAGGVVVMNSRRAAQRIDVASATGLIYVSEIYNYVEHY